MTKRQLSPPEELLTSDERRARLTALGLWPLALIGLLAVLAVPRELCLLRSWTDIPCPLCGGTHGFLAVLHGNFSAATRAFPMILPLIALALAHTGVAVAELVYRRHLITSRWFTAGWLIVTSGVILAWLVRLVLLAA